jgi:hypothetical protein
MSARGSLALGSKILAESKRLIPISWLAFLTLDNIESLLGQGFAEVERKTAIRNFELNAPFLTKITSGKLDFNLSERIINPVRSSRARTIGIGIAELLSNDGSENDTPGIAMVIDAIARKDATLSYVRPSREKVNPATGDSVKIPPVKLASTTDIIFSVCWITERWLKTATQDELEHMVTGNISA